MNVELQINNSVSPGARFVSWAPSPCRIRVTNPSGATTPTVSIRITGRSTTTGGVVVFRAGTTGAFASSVTLTVPINGTSVPFFVAGQFGRPSVNNGDVTIEARFGTTLVGSVPVMVRVRKNANNLTAGERDRFIAALAQLNNQGLGRFVDFREMHRTSISLAQAHGAPGFLPWHRAYLLDLERELQAIDPSVALHYWRFDQPSPNLFTLGFLGVANSLGTVQFSATNPLRFWVTDTMLGINRRPFFNTGSAPPGLRTEAQTLGLGTLYRQFRTMEGNPHGSAHTSFGGFIENPGTAPRDPLFFLLHCNVDRLWAKWQRQNLRFDSSVASSYDSNLPTGNRIGHNLPDTMWPWNGITGGQRPPTAPGGPLATSPAATAPGPSPRVRDCLDYQGSINPIARMGFDYDDVLFA
ncbi:MAG TPA: tyrosinase family protein [Thermoanaerobaculia bacterium]|nr:tyrosinase family protein [Thermoanaerobaculia bacterium]